MTSSVRSGRSVGTGAIHHANQPFFGRVLVGYYLLTDVPPDVPIDPLPPVIPNPGPVPPNSSGPFGSGGDSSGHGIHIDAVPEPSLLVLLIIGRASVLLFGSRRRDRL
jgi:hypothetical protein